MEIDLNQILDILLSWATFAGIGLILALVNLVRTLLGKTKGWQTMLFISLACCAVTIMVEYQPIYAMMQDGDWTGVETVLTADVGTIILLTSVGVVLNLVVAFLQTRHKRGD